MVGIRLVVIILYSIALILVVLAIISYSFYRHALDLVSGLVLALSVGSVATSLALGKKR
jgi:hypothetical protein